MVVRLRAQQPNVINSAADHSVPEEPGGKSLRLSLDNWARISGSAGLLCSPEGVVLEAAGNCGALFAVAPETLPGIRLAEISSELEAIGGLLETGPEAVERTVRLIPAGPVLRIRAGRCGTSCPSGELQERS